MKPSAAERRRRGLASGLAEDFLALALTMVLRAGFLAAFEAIAALILAGMQNSSRSEIYAAQFIQDCRRRGKLPAHKPASAASRRQQAFTNSPTADRSTGGWRRPRPP